MAAGPAQTGFRQASLAIDRAAIISFANQQPMVDTGNNETATPPSAEAQPIGADPKKNFNVDSWEAYGAGAFLLSGSEVIKL